VPGLFSQGIELLAFGRLQTAAHAFERRVTSGIAWAYLTCDRGSIIESSLGTPSDQPAF
jgi:hypothetical protein